MRASARCSDLCELQRSSSVDREISGVKGDTRGVALRVRLRPWEVVRGWNAEERLRRDAVICASCGAAALSIVKSAT